MTETTIETRNEHGELTARVTKRPDVDANPRAPFELLCVPMRDCAGWKMRVRGKRADGEEGELVLYGVTAVGAVRAAVEAWFGGEGDEEHVTIGGWYAAGGELRRYTWIAGQLHVTARARTWTEAARIDDLTERGVEESIQWAAEREPEGDVDRVTAPHVATLEAAEQLRRVIARRRDRLVAVQRRGYSTARARLIDALAADYDATLRIALAAGAELGLGADDEPEEPSVQRDAYGVVQAPRYVVTATWHDGSRSTITARHGATVTIGDGPLVTVLPLGPVVVRVLHDGGALPALVLEALS